MARELQGTHVGLLVPCPSSAANKNKVCLCVLQVRVKVTLVTRVVCCMVLMMDKL